MGNDTWFPPISEAYTGFLLDCQARRLTPATLGYYEHRLGTFVKSCGDLTIEQITPTYIRSYLAQMSVAGQSGFSVLGAARAVRCFFNFCLREEWIEKSPMARVKMPQVEKREPQVYTPEQIRTILKACISARDKAMILFLLDTGLRASELLALNVRDVDMGVGTVRVLQGKGQKDRTVYVGATARKALHAYYMTRRRVAPGDPVWLASTGGKRLLRNGMTQAMRRLSKRTGIHCKAHGFRRTFATQSLRAGMDIYTLQRLMGHEDITVLKHYVSIAQSDLEAAHKRYGVVDNL